jgi:hypothetical protein
MASFAEDVLGMPEDRLDSTFGGAIRDKAKEA